MPPLPKIVRLLALGCAGALATAGCQKDAPAPATPDQLLAGARWRLISRVSLVNLPGFTPVDEYAALPPCSQDDVERYGADNAYTYDEGPTKCDPLAPQQQPGLWFLGNQGTRLTVTSDGLSTGYAVDELTATSLKMRRVQQNNGIEETTTLAYKAVP